MKKKILFGIAALLIAAAATFHVQNVAFGEKESYATLESIGVMAAAQDESEDDDDDYKYIWRKNRYDCSYEYVLGGIVIKRWSCTNCAWDCEAVRVDADNPTLSNCGGDYSCEQAHNAGTF